MGKFRNGELAPGLGRQSSVFQMVRCRSACLLLSITTVVRRDRPTGDRAPGRHKVFAAYRRGSDSGNLRPPKSACAVDPDEKLEAIEATGPPALRKRPLPAHRELKICYPGKGCHPSRPDLSRPETLFGVAIILTGRRWDVGLHQT